MPQMSPLPWMTLSVTPLLVTYLMVMKKFQTENKSLKKNTNLYEKKYLQKWMW